MSDTFELNDDAGASRNDESRRREESRRDDRRESRREERRASSWSFDQIDSPVGRARMGGVSDQALGILMDAFESAKGYDDPTVPAELQRNKHQLIPIESGISNRAPALLVTLPTMIRGEAAVLVYVLLIEQDLGYQQTRTLSDRGDSYNALVLPEDQLDEKFNRAVRDRLRSLGKPVMVGAQVILATTIRQLGETTAAHRIAAIYNNAFEAIALFRDDLIQRMDNGHVDLSKRITKESIPSDARLELSFDFGDKVVEDSSGLPIRSDVSAVLALSRRSDTADGYDRLPFAEARMGLDLFYAPDEDNTTRGLRRRRDDDDRPFWQPVLNINSITPLIDRVPFNLGVVQLMLAQALLLSNDGRFLLPLRPRPKSASDTRAPVDIGVLPLCHPDPEQAVYVDDISPNMRESELADYLARYVKPEVAIGMTVFQSGEKSWVLSIFERIAITKKREFIDMLYDEADILTNGAFSRLIEERRLQNMLPVETTGTRALLGYYDGDNGKKRSVLEWNVLSVLSRLGPKHVEEALEFQDTFENTRMSVDRQLAERYEILNRFVPGLHIVGSAEQLVFNQDYLNTLVDALDEAEMLPVLLGQESMVGRRRAGFNAYNSHALADAGRAARGRDSGPRDRARRGIFGGGFYS